MTLKSTRDLALPQVPEIEEGVKDGERVRRWRKAHLSTLKDAHESVYDDLVELERRIRAIENYLGL